MDKQSQVDRPMGEPQVHCGHQPPSILVLTKDEEVNIADCLRTLSFSDDIVVLDSYSQDRTVEIARSFPHVRVVQRKFDNWSRHSNWALENIDFKHPWVYYSDADERLPLELCEEILRVINDPSLPHVAYRLRYQNMFMDSWLRHGGIYPVWIMRLFLHDRVRYEDREVNAHPVVDGSVSELREHFVHYSFNKGLTPWFQKHNSYSQMEAHEGLRVRQESLRSHLVKIMGRDKAQRRRALKNMSFYLPMRSGWRMMYMYLFKLGLLDGAAGFHYASMISMYEYWISLKMRESRQDWLQMTDQAARRLMGEKV